MDQPRVQYWFFGITSLKRPLIAIYILVIQGLPAFAGSMPPALQGKSAVVTWIEERVQRDDGESKLRSVGAQLELAMYFSSSRRVFSRFSITTSRYGKNEQVSDDVKASRVALFDGVKMSLMIPMSGNSGIRRVDVVYSPDFQHCDAQATAARRTGAESWLTGSLTHPGMGVEL